MLVSYLTVRQEHSNGILVIPTAVHGALQAKTSYSQYNEICSMLRSLLTKLGILSFLE